MSKEKIFGSNSEVMVAITKEKGSDKELDEHANASLFGSGLNLLKVIIGAGIMGLPMVIISFGLVLGPVILVLAGLASFLGLYLYLLCASSIGRTSSPSSLAQVTFPSAGIVLDLCIVLKSLGVSLSYVTIIGASVSKFLIGVFRLEEEELMADPRISILIVGIFVLLPLSFIQTSKKLQFTSGLGILSAIYLVLLSIYAMWVLPPSTVHIVDISWAYPISLSNVGYFGTAVFGFTCHQLIFTLYNETKNNRISSMSLMISTCIFVALTLYSIFSFSSLFSFADRLLDDTGTVLSWYPVDSLPFQLARLLYAALITFSYPLQALPYRNSLKRLLPFTIDSTKSDFLINYIGPTLFFWMFTVGVALKQPSFAAIMSLVGSFTSSVICYILPAIFYLRMSTITVDGQCRLPANTTLQIAALALGVFGVLVFLVCTFASLLLLF